MAKMTTRFVLAAGLLLALFLASPAIRAQEQQPPPRAAQAADEAPAFEKTPQAPQSEKTEKPKKKTGKKSGGEAPREPAGLRALGNTDVVPSDIQTKDDFGRNMPSPQIESPAVSVLRVIFSLLLVIGLIIATVYVLKYFYSRSMRLDLKTRHIRVLDTVSLGMNRSVYLVKTGEMVLLLGTGDKGLTLLADVTKAVDLEALLDETEGAADFTGQIARAAGPWEKLRQQGDKLTQFNTRLKDKLNKLDGDQDSKP